MVAPLVFEEQVLVKALPALTVGIALTVKLLLLVSIPLDVVTLIVPVLAVVGKVAVI